jgi:thiol-disulfide isomerase/thioredoxin
MLVRRSFLALTGAALLAQPAFAVGLHAARKFTPEAFKAAQDADKSILIEITATWCPMCKAQAPVLARVMTNPRFAEYVVFGIDFDAEKEALRRFEARLPGTLVVYRGPDEMGRSLGDTDPQSLAALLEMGL